MTHCLHSTHATYNFSCINLNRTTSNMQRHSFNSMSLARSLCFLGLSLSFFLFLLLFTLFSLSIDECIKVNSNVTCPQLIKLLGSIVHSLLAELLCLKSLIVFKLFHSQILSSPTQIIVFVHEVPLSTSRWTLSFWPNFWVQSTQPRALMTCTEALSTWTSFIHSSVIPWTHSVKVSLFHTSMMSA